MINYFGLAESFLEHKWQIQNDDSPAKNLSKDKLQNVTLQ